MQIGGLASGLDTQQIIRDLMQAERQPLNRIYQNQQIVEWQRDAYRDVNLDLRSFRESFADLRLQGTYLAHSVHSSDESVISGTAHPTSTAGTFSVKVEQLAEVAQTHSAEAVTVLDENGEPTNTYATRSTTVEEVLGEGAEGTFTIATQGGKATIEIEADDTLESVARKLANATNEDGESLGLRANFDDTTGRFFISTQETGEENWFEFSIHDDEGNVIDNANAALVEDLILKDNAHTLDHSFKGQDAIIYYAQGIEDDPVANGIEVTSSTNDIRINNMDLHLHNVSDDVQRMNVQADSDEVFDTITGFVDAYNELIDDLRGMVDEPRYRDYPPLTDEQREAMSEREIEMWEERAQSGMLRNDNILNSFLTNMRMALSNPVDGIPADQMNSLSQIGITTTSDYWEGGKLEIDEDRLREAISQNPDEVMQLFTRRATDEEEANNDNVSGFEGLGHRLYDQLNSTISRLGERAGMPGVPDGADQSTLGRNLHRISDEISRFEDRMQRTEERYWQQFTALERAMQQYNNQAMWMMENLFGGGQGMM